MDRSQTDAQANGDGEVRLATTRRKVRTTNVAGQQRAARCAAISWFRGKARFLENIETKMHTRGVLLLVGERLEKVLSRAGIASRRHTAQMVKEGRVSVNGISVSEPGYRVSPDDRVTLDGEPVGSREAMAYFALHKPPGYVSTLRDPQGRPTISHLIKGVRERVYPVGRLDLESEGLMLLTNDGELAARLMHPRYQVIKTYHVNVLGTPGTSVLRRLMRGIDLEDGPAVPVEVKVLGRWAKGARLEMHLTEGKKREIRRMCQATGHPVVRLRRVAIGPVRLGDLPSGEYRSLGPKEVRELKEAAGLRGGRTHE